MRRRSAKAWVASHVCGLAALALPAVQEAEFGAFQAETTGLIDPHSIAIGPLRTIYISETGANRIRVSGTDGSDVRYWPPEGGDRLLAPHGLALGDGGRLLVADTGHDRVVQLGPGGEVHAHWGGGGTGPGQLRLPTDVAVAGERIYVADSGNDRVQVFDMAGGLVATIGGDGRGRGDGRFRNPVALEVDAAGNLYVSDSDNHRIQMFDARGSFVRAWGALGSFPGFFIEPGGLCWRDGALYVADRLNHRVQVFGADGTFRYFWGLHALLPREGQGKIHYPSDVAADPAGDLLTICEPFEHRCQAFARWSAGSPGNQRSNPAGVRTDFGHLLTIGQDLLAMWEPETRAIIVFNIAREVPVLVSRYGEPGERFGQVGRLSGLHCDGQRLIVTDAENDRVQVLDFGFDPKGPLRFDPAMGRLVRSASFDVIAPGGTLRPSVTASGPDGNWYALDVVHGQVLVMSPEMRLLRSFGRIGDGDGEFRFPSGLAFSRSGETLYVVDPWAARVQAFDLEGRFLFSWSRWGSGAPFMRPGAIAAGRDGSVYVTDALADRVIRFDEQGRYLSDWGGRGTEVGRFWIPTGIGQDREERIFVLDYGNHRVQIFSPQGEWLVSFGMGRAFTRASPPRPP